MNAKKAKQLRRVARGATRGQPLRRLVIGKQKQKLIYIDLNYEQASRLGTELQELLEHEHVDGSIQARRQTYLASLMKQYMDQLRELYTPEQIAADEHVRHPPIRVQGLVNRVVAINDPVTFRGVYLATKRMIARLQRQLGYQKVGVGLAPV